MHPVKSALGGRATVPFGNVPELVSSRGFPAGDEIEFSVLQAEDTIAVFVFDPVEGVVLIKDD